MSIARQVEPISIEDYLAAEESQSIRHEYVDGDVYAILLC